MKRALPVLLAAALAACVQVFPPQQPGPAGARAPDAAPAQPQEKAEKDPFKPWDDVLEDTRAIDGYFRFHLKRDNTLLLELKPEQLGMDFGMAMHQGRGVADFGLNAGLAIDGEMRLMRFRRVGDQVQLLHLNPRFTAADGSPMRTAVEENVAHSIAATFKIESEHKETKALLLNVTSFFVSDYADLGQWFKLVYANRPVSLDRERSRVARVQGFPRNVEIDAELTFQATDPPLLPPEGVADFRSVPVGVRYSLVALPETPMRPRLADDRVGHFVTAVWDYSRDREPTPFIRYVNRWRLEKRDPAAELSEPVKPIVYYIDRSVPREYRRYVKEGIEAWNKAFEKAGFRNAIIAVEAPENDSTWSAEDIRYSTVRWTSDRGAWAIGPSQTDPRTGEILNADVLIAAGIVSFWAEEYQQLSGPDMLRRMRALYRGELPAARNALHRLCLAGFGVAQQLRLQHTLLAASGAIAPGDPIPEEYLGDAIRDLTMHEVGHTLGLRHNFKGSSGIPYDRLQDTAFTAEHGVTLSVMDYGTVNIAPEGRRQGHYWNKTVGTYDVWAIQYAYTPVYEQPADAPFAFSGTLAATPEAELVGLEKIARQAADPLHAYGTDEDNWLGPFAVDPLTNAWDLGSDPVRFARDRTALVKRLQPRLEARLIAPGQGYQRLRDALSTLIIERYRALFPVTKEVGGLYVSRAHKGDPDARPPFTPVPAARQREAVRAIVEGALAEDAFRFEPELLAKLAPNRWAHWGVSWFELPMDFPVLEMVGLVQTFLMEELLDPVRVNRLVANELRARPGEAFTAAELFRTVTDAVWSELGETGTTARPVNAFRRNLQRAHLSHLGGMLVAGGATLLITPGGARSVGTPEDARSLARLELTRLSARMAQVLAVPGGLDAMTRAHLEESKARIDRVLEASMTTTVR